jgi:hypothetical protein
MGLIFFAICVLLALAATIFWIWMLIDCISQPMESTEKLIWVLVIIFLHLLGAVLYFVIKRKAVTV